MSPRGSQPLSPSSLPSPTQKKFYFSRSTDIFLFQAVLACNPFEADYGNTPERWQEVADMLKLQGYPASARTCQDRTENALKSLGKQLAESRRASGIDEKHDEWMKLAEQVAELKKDAKEERARKKTRPREQREQAIKMREEATRNIRLKTDPEGPSDSERGSVVPGKRGRGPGLSTREAWGNMEKWRRMDGERADSMKALEQERIDLEHRRMEKEQAHWEEERKDKEACLERELACREKEQARWEEERKDKEACLERELARWEEDRKDRQAQREREYVLMKLFAEMVKNPKQP
jgi:hypothetical protein